MYERQLKLDLRCMQYGGCCLLSREFIPFLTLGRLGRSSADLGPC
jgi:hypothetical protein